MMREDLLGHCRVGSKYRGDSNLQSSEQSTDGERNNPACSLSEWPRWRSPGWKTVEYMGNEGGFTGAVFRGEIPTYEKSAVIESSLYLPPLQYFAYILLTHCACARWSLMQKKMFFAEWQGFERMKLTVHSLYYQLVLKKLWVNK